MVSSDLMEILEEGKNYALDSLKEDGALQATAIVTTDTEVFILPMEGSGKEAKEQFRSDIKSAIEESGATGVCIIAEVWFDTVPLSPEERQERTRREGMLVYAENSDGETVSVLADVERSGVRVDVGDWRTLGGVGAQGKDSLFTGFFKPKRPLYLN